MSAKLRHNRFGQNSGTPLVTLSQYPNSLMIKIYIFDTQSHTLHKP